jgi:hypothetical protein
MRRFFGDGTIPIALRLVGSEVSKTGVTISTYERADASQRRSGHLGRAHASVT